MSHSITDLSGDVLPHFHNFYAMEVSFLSEKVPHRPDPMIFLQINATQRFMCSGIQFWTLVPAISSPEMHPQNHTIIPCFLHDV